MEAWEPDETYRVENQECTSWCTALFWVVPAKVGGTWRTPQGDLTLEQKFQMVSGTLNREAITDGKLRGDEITFKAGGNQYTGRVNGNSISGTISSGGTWNATRTGS
jgi:hypothetical protein